MASLVPLLPPARRAGVGARRDDTSTASDFGPSASALTVVAFGVPGLPYARSTGLARRIERRDEAVHAAADGAQGQRPVRPRKGAGWALPARRSRRRWYRRCSHRRRGSGRSAPSAPCIGAVHGRRTAVVDRSGRLVTAGQLHFIAPPAALPARMIVSPRRRAESDLTAVVAGEGLEPLPSPSLRANRAMNPRRWWRWIRSQHDAVAEGGAGRGISGDVDVARVVEGDPGGLDPGRDGADEAALPHGASRLVDQDDGERAAALRGGQTVVRSRVLLDDDAVAVGRHRRRDDQLARGLLVEGPVDPVLHRGRGLRRSCGVIVSVPPSSPGGGSVRRDPGRCRRSSPVRTGSLPCSPPPRLRPIGDGQAGDEAKVGWRTVRVYPCGGRLRWHASPTIRAGWGRRHTGGLAHAARRSCSSRPEPSGAERLHVDDEAVRRRSSPCGRKSSMSAMAIISTSGDAALRAEVEHLLGLRDAADERPADRAATHDERTDGG